MILQALDKYYERMKDDLPSEGFEQKEIPFLIVINQSGEFINLQDTRTQSGKRLIARKFLVPKEKARSGKNAWKSANLLWDHYGYVLGHPKSDTGKDEEMAKKQRCAFIAQVEALDKKYPTDTDLQAVRLFYINKQYIKVFADLLWNDCKKINGCNLSFQINTPNHFICQSENVIAYVKERVKHDSSDDSEYTDTCNIQGICMITGERASIARLHPRTPIAGAKSNAKIVSFQKNMGFDSYGKQQNYNAPVSKHAAFAYTTALNYMLAKDSRQKIYVGDATTVFWTEKKHEIEDWFTDIFGEPAKGESDQDNAAIRALFASVKTGAPPVDWNLNHFYVLGLAPNSARIAIRFWYAGTVAEVVINILQHFKDISITHAPYQSEYLSLFRLLVSMALQGKSANIQPNLAGDFMKTILSGTPYPRTLMLSAIRRIKAEQEVTYPRASLIKAVLVRQARYNNKKEDIGMALDLSNKNIGYRLGCLFAILEKIQEEANPGINATIRDRFYGSASSTPVTAFPYLMKLKNHHFSKLENRGRAVNLEKMIGVIVDDIQDVPGHLSLGDQGRFAVGYYHQRQDFFKKKEAVE